MRLYRLYFRAVYWVWKNGERRALQVGAGFRLPALNALCESQLSLGCRRVRAWSLLGLSAWSLLSLSAWSLYSVSAWALCLSPCLVSASTPLCAVYQGCALRKAISQLQRKRRSEVHVLSISTTIVQRFYSVIKARTDIRVSTMTQCRENYTSDSEPQLCVSCVLGVFS